ncbi:hypothetical protein RF11_06199 [Thelohanellus kitauei]|uniref:Uncharacterized protein n=1 Tax=Thelohanellus kitauei TaxID=669202 RepID=A0A0C2IEH3_THEKT|nr:hypothetical protein RF11_06199 [Thelohanellus kitauei]
MKKSRKRKSMWIILSQKSHYAESYANLQSSKPDKFCKENCIFLDNSKIMRVKTRLNLSNLEYLSAIRNIGSLNADPKSKPPLKDALYDQFETKEHLITQNLVNFHLAGLKM